MESTRSTIQETACYHCGEQCSHDSISYEGKDFCCRGCSTVYQILSENDLDTYYTIDKLPGISFKQEKKPKRFDYLEHQELLEKLIDFKQGAIAYMHLSIPAIHCTSCVWLLENFYKLNDAVTQCSVNFLKREFSFSFDTSKTSLKTIVEQLSSIGYEPKIQLEHIEQKKEAHPNRKIWLKLGIAGFSFGNIMLLSFPDYLAQQNGQVHDNFSLVFGLLSIVLSLPVLFYSGIDYLKSAWAAIRQRGINLDVPISIGILALFIRSIYEIGFGMGTGYLDSFTGLVFFLLIGRLIQEKTYQRLYFERDYKSYLPLSVTILDDSLDEQTLSIDRLQPGQKMMIRNSELIPADATLLSETCLIDYSFITGESEPQLIQQNERVYAGGKIVGATALMETIKEVSNSYLTDLWNNDAFDKETRELRLTNFADRISPYFTAIVLGIAVISSTWWWQTNIEQAIYVFTAVLIIACPCALALSTPFTLSSAVNILSHNGFFIKKLTLVEKLAKCDTIVFDKTGTLTQNAQNEVTFSGPGLDYYNEHLVAAACKQSIHPLSQEIARQFDLIPHIVFTHFEEIPNKGIEAHVHDICLRIGSRDFVCEHIENIIPAGDYYGAYSMVHISINDEYLGCYEIKSAYRNGLKRLIDKLKHAYQLVLLSGDNDGQKEQLQDIFGSSVSLYFNQSPQDKLDHIAQLKAQKKTVAMVGDGLNDAGALQESDFGISVSDDVSAFVPACDAIINGSKLSSLSSYLGFAKAGIRVIWASFGISLLYNLVGLGFAITGNLSPLVAAVLMPLSSITIMGFTVLSTHIIAKKKGLAIWV